MKRGEDVAENKNLNIIYRDSTPFISFPCDFDVSILSSGVEDIEMEPKNLQKEETKLKYVLN